MPVAGKGHIPERLEKEIELVFEVFAQAHVSGHIRVHVCAIESRLRTISARDLTVPCSYQCIERAGLTQKTLVTQFVIDHARIHPDTPQLTLRYNRMI
jgi:hypothetical protein